MEERNLGTVNHDLIEKRRTFAIISHPDAGKTTLTEKLLLYTGTIQLAGSVKGKKTDKHAVSDWMEIEKQRGISVTSSVMQFNYDGYCVNIIDTPGHQDFSEDTYRTLMAADSAVMVIDASKGVEAQTRKLFKVCTFYKAFKFRLYKFTIFARTCIEHHRTRIFNCFKKGEQGRNKDNTDKSCTNHSEKY